MKLLQIGATGDEIPAVLGEDGRVCALAGLTADIDGAFLATGGTDRAAAALAAGHLPELDPAGLRIGAPVTRPGKVVCVGLNYRDHAAETGAVVPERPVVFMKDPATVVGPYDQVLIPRGSVKTDWEVDLAVVIGREARYLASPDEAAARIASVVNIGSIVTTTGLPQRALYSASKGAVLSLTLAMAADHVGEGIRVNCVNPGTVDTPWVGRLLEAAPDPAAERAVLNARQPTGRLITAEEVAAAIVYLASPAAVSVTGTALAVDGGMAGLRLRPEVKS
ncbi:SDR family oxidoreductase [Streptomyces sp. NPDC002766]|uniref:SDR family oxidoreductase n=1 Tax=Streptomyces sp. NPDC002766 TaxID=3154429 RepID=UPI0033217EDA